MTSFYMTLHSDGASHVQTSNTQSSFTIHFGQTLDLEGQWEVGLAEIHFPMTMPILSKEDCFITMMETKFVAGKKQPPNSTISLTSSYFESVIFDVIDINSPVSTYYDNEGLIHMLWKEFDQCNIDFSFIQGLARLSPRSTLTKYLIHFPPALLNILGLDNVPATNIVQGTRKVDVRRGLPQQLFVYTDIIHHQMVGSTHDRLLRIVPNNMDGYNFGCQQCQTFPTLHYYPVCKNKLEAVEINIRDCNNETLLFEHGTLTVILHFRKVPNV